MNMDDKRIAECLARCEAAKTNPQNLREHEALLDFTSNAMTDLPDALAALVEARKERDEAMQERDKWKRIRTPTHGSCCTCQTCGQFYDDCRCDLDDVADDLAEALRLLRCHQVNAIELISLDDESEREYTRLYALVDETRAFLAALPASEPEATA